MGGEEIVVDELYIGVKGKRGRGSYG